MTIIEEVNGAIFLSAAQCAFSTESGSHSLIDKSRISRPNGLFYRMPGISYPTA